MLENKSVIINLVHDVSLGPHSFYHCGFHHTWQTAPANDYVTYFTGTE